MKSSVTYDYEKIKIKRGTYAAFAFTFIALYGAFCASLMPRQFSPRSFVRSPNASSGFAAWRLLRLSPVL